MGTEPEEKSQKKEKAVKTVALAMPTYGPVEPLAYESVLAAVMHASNNGIRWAGPSVPKRMGWQAARNIVVESVVNSDEIDGIVWLDSDIVLPIDAITKLVHRGLDFVTGIYFQRAEPYWPLVAHFDENKEVFNWFIKWPENSIAPIDGCGFGCVYTSKQMFRDMEPKWFEYLKFSEDFDFCLKASSAGYQLYVDTSILCGHLQDPKPVTHETFIESNPKFFVEENSNGICKQTGDPDLQKSGDEPRSTDLGKSPVELRAV